MTWAFSVVEVSATLCESVVAICAISAISGAKSSGMKRASQVGLCSGLLTGGIFILNMFSSFSFLTIGITFILALLFTSFLSNGPTILRCTATVITYLVIHAIDYICLFTFCMIIDSPVTDTDSFSVLLGPSFLRCIYLVVDKSVDVLLILLLRAYLSKLQNMRNSQYILLFLVSTLVYTTMSMLIALIMGKSIFAMQSAVMLSWIFSCLCVLAVIALFLLTTNNQLQKQRNKLLRTANQLMTQNYQELYANHQAFAKRIHDFNHHIKALQVLATQENAKETVAYTQSLLKTSYVERKFCRSGNNVIDAIINCKSVEAENLEISFSYSVNLPGDINIDPVDICAVLSNQIENAFEACKLITDSMKRDVSVDIWHKNGNMVFFRVANYVEENPLVTNPALRSTKVDHQFPHGFGVQNISDTAAKYGGALSNTYQDNHFVSTVFLCL